MRVYEEVRFRSLDYRMKVAVGMIPGASYIEKFGRNKTVASGTQEPIWDGSGAYSYPTTARIHNIASTDAADDSAGTGARTVSIQGLDGDYNLKTETVIMDGTSNVATKISYTRIFRMRVETSGSGGTNAGVISATAVTDATVTAQILASTGQTNMALYTIPAGYTGYLLGWYASLLRATGVTAVGADVDFIERNFGGAWRSKQPTGIQNTGQGHWHYDFEFPLALSEKSDMQVIGTPTAAADISAGFTILLLKN